jgi:hypothetical protein
MVSISSAMPECTVCWLKQMSLSRDCMWVLLQLLYMCWLQAGVGLWYAHRYKLANMAAAYLRLIHGMCSVQPAALAVDAWPDDREVPWLVELRTAVLGRTLEVLPEPQELGQLMGRLEASGWLQQARQSPLAEGMMQEDAAQMEWVVDATSFTASGAVVVEPTMQPPPAAAAAAAEAASGTNGSAAATAAGASGTEAVAAVEAAASSSSGAASGTSRRASRRALALPPQVICALHLLSRVLLIPKLPLKAPPLADVITSQDLELLEALLMLGMPAAQQPLLHGIMCGALPCAVGAYESAWYATPFSGAALDKAAAAIKVSMHLHRSLQLCMPCLYCHTGCPACPRLMVTADHVVHTGCCFQHRCNTTSAGMMVGAFKPLPVNLLMHSVCFLSCAAADAAWRTAG